MTLEDLKKNARPLVWKESGNPHTFSTINAVAYCPFIIENSTGEWEIHGFGRVYPNKEEAMQSVEEYHIRELAKFFVLDKD